MRVLIGQIAQESNSFIDLPTELANFEGKQYFRGDEVLTGLLGTRATMAGFLAGLEGTDELQLVPTVAAWAPSGGPLSTDCFESLLAPLEEATGPQLDGVLLALHGAMMTDRHDDADGELLRRVRQHVGPTVPVIATLDLHANITPAMLEHADGLIGYDTYPHIDLYEVGERAAAMLRGCVQTGRRPRTLAAKVPMIVPAEGMATSEEPMGPLLDDAFALRERAGVVSTSLFAVQPWLDVEDTGFTALAVIDDAAATDATLAALVEIADEAWSRREEFLAPLVDVDEGIDRALRGDGPVVLSDSADATGAGSAGDSAFVIERLLARDPDRPCVTCIVAPRTVAAAIDAGVGATVTVEIGAQVDPRWTQPMTVTGFVRTLSSGHFRYRGRKSRGLEVSMGRAAVLQVGAVFILAMERPAETIDPGMYESVGLPPERAAVVLVRSANQFRDSYRDIATETLILDTPGPSTARLERLPWQKVRRPIHPLDDVDDVEVRTFVGADRSGDRARSVPD